MSMSHSKAVLAQPKYPAPQVSSVAEMLDPSKPLVKSNLPVTKPVAPKFVDPSEAEKRRAARQGKKEAAAEHTSRIYTQRLNERKFLKAQYEFDREKKLAEQTIYKREKQGEWKSKSANSPFLVDLVADSERIEEEMGVRTEEERRRRAQQNLRKKKIKNEIIVKTLSEAPQLDVNKQQKREQLEEEQRMKALRDIKKSEKVYQNKVKEQQIAEQERKEKLELAALDAPIDSRRF